MRSLILVSAMSGLLGVTACASIPKPEDGPVKMSLTITASSDVNPDETKRPAPIVVRLYELKYAGTFEESDYFSLQDKDKAVLGEDLVARDQFQLRPGEVRPIARDSHQGATVLGVIAAYRDLPNSVWRTTWPLPPVREPSYWYRTPRKLTLKINLDAKAIAIVDEPQNK